MEFDDVGDVEYGWVVVDVWCVGFVRVEGEVLGGDVGGGYDGGCV